MNRTVPLLLGIGLVLMVPAGQLQADCRVWTVTETTRVLRDDPGGSRASVNLTAARNEWESFQILLRSDTPVAAIRVQPGDLTGPKGALLPAGDARLYRAHQLHITEPTYRNQQFKPGWYPDPLIPFRHPLSGQPLSGGRFTAVPFDLPANQTHGFWIDVFVPREAAAGEYCGTYRVLASEKLLATIPVRVGVWDFELPQVATLATAFGSPAERLRTYYARRSKEGREAAPTDWDAVDRQCAEMLARHRINATPPPGSFAPVVQPDGSYQFPPGQIDTLREFVDRYHVSAVRTPHPTRIFNSPTADREKVLEWLACWDRAAAELDRPNVVFYTYLKDEPNDEAAYDFVRRWGKVYHEARTVVKVLVVEQTSQEKKEWGDLYGAVDIWCPLFPLFDAESAARRQALGETIWTYTALCQREMTPRWHTDYPLLHYRVSAWIAWRYGIRGLLYWGGMVYWNDVDDPWTEPATLDRRDRRAELIYNGEGSLLYPGRAVGYEGVAPSIRLKTLRDAIEDYQYMAILQRLKTHAEAEKLVLPLARSWFSWDPDPAVYQRTRVRLAEQIIEAMH